MKLSFTRRNAIVVAVIVSAVAGAAIYYSLSGRTLAPMERYVPAQALAFAQIDSLPDLVDGFTGTDAWKELAPILGLSSQWRQVGSVASLVSRTGLGPDE